MIDFLNSYKYADIIAKNRLRNDFECPICGRTTPLKDAHVTTERSSCTPIKAERFGNATTTTYRTVYHNYRICPICMRQQLLAAKIWVIIAVGGFFSFYAFIIITYCCSGTLFGSTLNVVEFILCCVGLLFAYAAFASLLYFIINLFFKATRKSYSLEEALRKNAVD